MNKLKLLTVSALFTIILIIGNPVKLHANDEPLSDPQKEQIARNLMKEIRCLVCQNQSIEDSNADLAKDLRRIVREQINNNRSPEQTKAYLVARYGDWVLLKPPVNTGTFLLWASPFIIILPGFWLLFRRSQSATSAPQELTSAEKEQLNTIIKADAEIDDEQETRR
jgi:cytochrome c-type biogenesis protein CcmH